MEIYMKEIITTLLFLIAVIDPLGSIPVYLEATKNFNKKEKQKVIFVTSGSL